MYLLLIALLLTGLKLLGIGPAANWSWWWVAGVYAATAAWWGWADATGYTRRRAEDRMAVRKAKRLKRQKADLQMRSRSRQ